jgi:hypothetical protein
MFKAWKWWFSTTASEAAEPSFILMEDAGYVLMEDESKIIIE